MQSALKIGAFICVLPVALTIFWLAALSAVRIFFEARYIPSATMEPALKVGDRIIVNKAFYIGSGNQKRGDIVIFYPPPIEMAGQDLSYDLPHVLGRATGLPFFPYEVAFVKRIIGLPGDTIRIERAVGVFVNGKLLDEEKYYKVELPGYDLKTLGDIGAQRYLKGKESHLYAGDKNPIIVPAGKFFVLGDKRNASEDSHVWGFLDKERIIGRAAFKLTDDGIDAIETPSYSEK